MENYQEIAPVKDREALKKAGVYITPKTLRKWHCLGINPQLFLKIEGLLYIDLNEWRKMVDSARKQTQERCERLSRLGITDPKQAA